VVSLFWIFHFNLLLLVPNKTPPDLRHEFLANNNYARKAKR